MSMLLFYVGENGYVIDSHHILRIVPSVKLEKMLSAPIYIVGLLNLEAKLIPVLDFCLLIERRPARPLLSSRIILIKDPKPESERVLGLLGENVKDLLNIRLEQFSPIDFSFTSFPYLNRLFSNDNQIIQYLDIAEFFKFLSADLFHSTENEIKD